RTLVKRIIRNLGGLGKLCGSNRRTTAKPEWDAALSRQRRLWRAVMPRLKVLTANTLSRSRTFRLRMLGLSFPQFSHRRTIYVTEVVALIPVENHKIPIDEVRLYWHCF